MNRIHLFLLLSGLLVSCGQGTEVSSDLSRYELTSINGSSHQKATLTTKDGEILEEGFVENGVKDGQWIYYNPQNESIKKIENYLEGKLNGVVLEFSTLHETTSRTHYVAGQKDGYHAQYKRGRMKLEGYYKDGQLHGRMTKYHDYSSKILSETDYKYGKQHGIYRYYDPEGNITLDYLYENGEKVRGGIVDE